MPKRLPTSYKLLSLAWLFQSIRHGIIRNVEFFSLLPTKKFLVKPFVCCMYVFQIVYHCRLCERTDNTSLDNSAWCCCIHAAFPVYSISLSQATHLASFISLFYYTKHSSLSLSWRHLVFQSLQLSPSTSSTLDQNVLDGCLNCCSVIAVLKEERCNIKVSISGTNTDIKKWLWNHKVYSYEFAYKSVSNKRTVNK